MQIGDWEIGVNSEKLDELFSGEQAGMTLWFMAGYLKGLSDSSAVQNGERQLVLEPDGDQGWRLRSSQTPAPPQRDAGLGSDAETF